jgi:G3E family GTPase
MNVLNGDLCGVIRAKGHFWIATRPDWVAEYSLAGSLSSVKPLGTWWASVPEDRWPKDDIGKKYMKQNWEEPWGDRRQEIVFIGSDINWSDIKSKLDNALVSETIASLPDALSNFNDPFPIWRRAEEAA